MSELKQPEGKPEPTFQARSTVVPTIPADLAYPLREDEYRNLCDGASGAERASRDVCLGLLGGTVVGILSVCATVDWKNFWVQKSTTLLFWLGALVFIAAGSAAGCAFYWIQMHRKTTPHSRLRKSLDEYFKINPA